uniref:Uncharacterized protein n=1 Tax=Cacopsylla melanoneura TaxID=428564 RepID=A0A8D8TXU8_9HEMI
MRSRLAGEHEKNLIISTIILYLSIRIIQGVLFQKCTKRVTFGYFPSLFTFQRHIKVGTYYFPSFFIFQKHILVFPITVHFHFSKTHISHHRSLSLFKNTYFQSPFTFSFQKHIFLIAFNFHFSETHIMYLPWHHAPFTFTFQRHIFPITFHFSKTNSFLLGLFKTT